MSLILNALRKLEQQDAFPACEPKVESDETTPDGGSSDQALSGPIEPAKPETDFAAANDAVEEPLPASAPASDALDEPDPNSTDSDVEPVEDQEIEEDYNIPATDTLSEESLSTWADDASDQGNSGFSEEAVVNQVQPEEHVEPPVKSDGDATVFELANGDLDAEFDKSDLVPSSDIVEAMVDAEFTSNDEEHAVTDEVGSSADHGPANELSETLPFYNPVVDVVDLDELNGGREPFKNEVEPSWPTEVTQQADHSAGEEASAPEAASSADAALEESSDGQDASYQDDHFFLYEDEPESVYESTPESIIGSQPESDFKEDSDGLAEKQQDEFEAIQGGHDEFSSDNTPWTELPDSGAVEPSPIDDDEWTTDSTQAADESTEWLTEPATDDDLADRTVDLIEKELDQCNELAIAAVQEGDPAFDRDSSAYDPLPTMTVADDFDVSAPSETPEAEFASDDSPDDNLNEIVVETVSDPESFSKTDQESDHETNAESDTEPPSESADLAVPSPAPSEELPSQPVIPGLHEPATVAPSDFERQILERLTNPHYEKRFTEIYQNVVKLVQGRERICVAVVSPLPSEITHRMAAHLAIVIASHQRQRVQLIDANEGRQLSKNLGHDSHPGLISDIVETDTELTGVPTSLTQLQFVPAGNSDLNDLDGTIARHSTDFQNMVAQSVNEFDVTIIDAGGGESAAAKSAAAISDVVLLIAELGQTLATNLSASEKRLKVAGAKQIGCVLSGEYGTEV